jgi:nitric oxide dioxygenase
MFANHPELLNVFNHANQKKGRQQTALAAAVYAAAKYIDNLEAIIPVVKQIGHKHRSLGIKPEQYPIVGRNLLAAIKDVLGDAATEEVLNAWAEAYDAIANVFISVEAEMYKEAEEQEGGWSGFRAFRVVRKTKESDVIASFYLAPADGKRIAAFRPGQYITIKAEIPGEKYTHLRQYSLSDAPGKSYYRITVKREDDLPNQPNGIVSVYLHNHVQEGDLVYLSAPAGDFVLDETDSRPLVLISGGVGLTPMVSMLQHTVETNPARPITFIHAARNGDVHALREEVEEAARRCPSAAVYWCYEKPTEADRKEQRFHKEGYIDLNWLKEIIPDPDASFYFCGPIPFMKAVNVALKEWGVPAKDIHYEFFGPSGSLE